METIMTFCRYVQESLMRLKMEKEIIREMEERDVQGNSEKEKCNYG